MDKIIIPEYLLPITQRLGEKRGPLSGRYLTGDKLIPEDWTVYEREGNKIIRDGDLTTSDIKFVPDEKLSFFFMSRKLPKWYVAKDNEQLKTPFYLQKVPRTKSPRSPSPKTPPPSPPMTPIRSPRSTSQEKKEEFAGKTIKKFMKRMKQLKEKRSSPKNSRGGKKSRTRRRNRRGTRRRTYRK